MRRVALIPARSGSKRVKNKNIIPFNGHPMIAYTISCAIKSNSFDDVICATDSEEYSKIARYYGAEVPMLRPNEISGDKSPDIEWVKWILDLLKKCNRTYDVFSILRPTSPFRNARTIKNAMELFISDGLSDSLRAIRKCTEHPGKMWVLNDKRMQPLMPFSTNGTPWHSSQYAALPEIYVQDASLEIAWCRTVERYGSIAGCAVMPLISHGLEGFDINTPEDLVLANYLLESEPNLLPNLEMAPYR